MEIRRQNPVPCNCLRHSKELAPYIPTKSSVMIGVGKREKPKYSTRRFKMKRTKSIFSIFSISLISLFVLSACGQNYTTPVKQPVESAKVSVAPPAASGKETVIEVAHMYSTDHPVHLSLAEAEKFLNEKTQGRIKLKIYPNGSYGDQKNAIQAVRLGTLDVFESAPLPEYYAPAGALFGPYLFRDYDHWDKFKKSDVATEILDKTGEGMGVKQLSLHQSGFRQTVMKKAVKTPNDFKGLKLRVVNLAPYPEVATILNAVGTPLPITDVYMALKTGVVDGTENPLAQIYSTKFYEVAKYLILTNHMITPSNFIMSKKKWDSFSVEDQKIVKQAFETASNFIDEQIKKQEQDYITKLEKEGMTVVKPDQDLFMKRTNLVLDKYPDWKPIYEKVQAIK
jgi:tripartite ATP-independent transporter DctP family solute receptor